MPLPLAEIGIPDARHCAMVLGPIAAFFGLRWLGRHTEEIVYWLFPGWQWDKELGWLNARAERQANTVLRWLGHLIHAVLAVALYGIVWSAQGISAFWNGPDAVAAGAWKISVLLVCLGVWAVYLGCDLIPKLFRDYEGDELAKFRARQRDLETEEEPAASRFGKKTLGPLLSSPRPSRRR